MTGLQEMVFISEVALQTKIAKLAGARLKAASDTFNKVEVWMSIQSILVAAGNVSKILWPRKVHKLRGERLRQLLKVEDSNILRDRNFRKRLVPSRMVIFARDIQNITGRSERTARLLLLKEQIPLLPLP